MSEPYHLRRHDKALTGKAALEDVLLSARFITVSMCAGDEPYAVAVNHGYDCEQSCLYFHCAPDGKKMDFLSRNPRVWGMAVIDLGYQDGTCDHAYRSVMFGGRVTFVRSESDKRRALEVMIRQQESDPARVIGEQLTEARVQSVTIGRIEIEELSGKEALPHQGC